MLNPKLANNLSVDVEELKLLNPKFRSDFVPISRGSETVVRIPVGKGTDALAALSLQMNLQLLLPVIGGLFVIVTLHSGLGNLRR